jgi:peptide/nickel transport system substrate-binding protein
MSGDISDFLRQAASDSHEGRLDRSSFLKNAGRLGISISAAGALFGDLASDAFAAGTASKGGTLNFARNQEALTLNPVAAGENGSIWMIPQIFDQLLEVRHGFTDPQPGLAKSWHASKNGLEWTFNLRSARFSDGSPVTAEDVKYSIDRVSNPKIAPNFAALGSSIKSVTVVNERTVLITLKHVDGGFLDSMATFAPSILPEKVVTAIGDKAFGEKPIGSGPFMLKRWRRGVALELVRNPYYWRSGSPLVDGVVFQTVADDNTRLLKLQSGESHVAAEIPYSQISRINGIAGLSVLTERISTWNCVALNNATKPLNDVRVRQALAHATPREAIRNSVLFGKADLANSQIGRVKYWDPRVYSYSYDLAKASSLMKSSSAPKGFNLPLLTSSGDVVEQQTAEIIKAEWSKIGVNVAIEEADIGTAIGRWYGGKATSFLFPGNALSSDTLSDDELDAICLDYNGGIHSLFTNYNSPALSKLIHASNRTLDDKKRRRLFSQIQALGQRDTPTIALFFTSARTGLSDKVRGFGTVQTGWWNLDRVSLGT